MGSRYPTQPTKLCTVQFGGCPLYYRHDLEEAPTSSWFQVVRIAEISQRPKDHQNLTDVSNMAGGFTSP